MPEILPSSALRETKNTVYHKGAEWVPIFCANCGVDCGFIPNHTFAFFQCDPCATKFPCPEGFYRIPDEVFFEKFHAAMLDHYGRELTEFELVEEAKNGDSIIAKLVRDRFTPDVV